MTGGKTVGFRICRFVSCAAVLAALCLHAAGAAADPAKVKTVEAKAPIAVDGKAGLRTTNFRRVRVTVPLNERVGELQDGMFCSTKGNFSMTQKLADAVMRQVGRAWRGEAVKAGYPARPSSSESVFEEKPAVAAPADFDVGATIRAMQLHVCVRGADIWGGVWFEIKWEVYSTAARKVMFDTVTEGSFQNTGPEKLPMEEFFARALAVAARGVLADQRYVDLVSGAVELPAAAVQVASYALPRGRPPEGGAQQNATVLRGSVVTIEGGGRTGSGFFVSRDGYVLTNAHVVGNLRIVKVKLATGRELVGEVLKLDTARDVALVKTEIAGIEPLAIRESEPNVGEDVFALGSPLGEKFSGTLTRGILSGHRTLGERRFLQSDVAILPGSSGGPLLDSGGAVIGLTVAAVDSGRANLNLFIPIREALDKLAIEIK